MTASSLSVRQSSPSEPAGLPSGVVRWDYRSQVDGHDDWALLWPGEQSCRWAVYLHGHGSGGDQIFTRADVRDHWLAAMRRHGLGVLAPNLRGNEWMGPAAVADLHALLAAVRQQFGTARFLLTGGSMGGSSVLAYTANHPEDAAACVAVCPATDIGGYATWCQSHDHDRPVLGEIRRAIVAAYGGSPEDMPQPYARHSACRQAARLTMPVALAHAAGDAVIPVDESRRLAHCLRSHRAFRYEEEPAGHHDSPLLLFPGLLDWALSHIS